jgi:hypothetical protein
MIDWELLLLICAYVWIPGIPVCIATWYFERRR